MSFYRIKPYNIIMLRYKGNGNFNMQVFNDNVEIDYPLRFFATVPPTQLSKGDFTDLEMEKMAAKFLYTTSGNSRMSYNLAIQREHLQISDLVEVKSHFYIGLIVLNISSMTSIYCIIRFCWKKVLLSYVYILRLGG